MLLFVFAWCHAHYPLKLPVEIGIIIKAALKANSVYGKLIIQNQLAGKIDSYFYKKVYIGFLMYLFEKSAK